jgi:hypothetical protein
MLSLTPHFMGYWSDGKLAGHFGPDLSPLLVCPVCAYITLSDEFEKISEAREAGLFGRKWMSPTLEEFNQFIERHTFSTPMKELHIRNYLRVKVNLSYRQSPISEHFSLFLACFFSLFFLSGGLLLLSRVYAQSSILIFFAGVLVFLALLKVVYVALKNSLRKWSDSRDFRREVMDVESYHYRNLRRIFELGEIEEELPSGRSRKSLVSYLQLKEFHQIQILRELGEFEQAEKRLLSFQNQIRSDSEFLSELLFHIRNQNRSIYMCGASNWRQIV